MNKLDQLKRKYAELTYRLKQMSGTEPDYAKIWDDRVDVRLQIMKIEKK